MDIRNYSYLFGPQIKEIKELEKKCCRHEDLKVEISIDSSLNFDSSMKSFFLSYEGDTLAGMLSIFAPTRNEAEISAYTAPEYRRKGFFKHLMVKASDELEKYGIASILLLCDRRSGDGKKTFKNMGARYGFTEHTLVKYELGFPLETDKPTRIILRRATGEDLQVLAAVDALIFRNDVGIVLEMIKRTMNSRDREQYAAVLNNRIIGLCSVFYEGGKATVFGVGVLPQFQGKGYGRELMGLVLRIISDKGIKDVMINVNSRNIRAYNLYTSLGFKTLFSIDYYRMSTLDLKFRETM